MTFRLGVFRQAIKQDDEQVEVTVHAGIATGAGAKHPDHARPQHGNQTIAHKGDGGLRTATA